jgi:hypothetical protein
VNESEHDRMGGAFLLVLLVVMVVLGASVPWALFRIAHGVERCMEGR